MNFDSYETLQFSRRDRVLTVTIDGPGPVNAVNKEMHNEFARVFSDLQNDPDSDLIVLTGAGRAFCAGGDMEWFEDMNRRPLEISSYRAGSEAHRDESSRSRETNRLQIKRCCRGPRRNDCPVLRRDHRR